MSTGNKTDIAIEGNYSVDWFTNNIPRWKEHFNHLAGKPLKMLELGSYEGMSAVWMLHNVLSHPKSEITCVDNFVPIPEFHKGKSPMSSTIKRRFLANTKPFSNKVKLIAGDTRDVLKKTNITKKQFDIVYIDAGRHSKNVIEDAVLSFPLLKVGGHIVFDDYTNSKKHDYTCPKKGIDAFLDIFSDELEVVNTSWQVIAVKIEAKKSKVCKSELN
jgi:predicted O-methyltransferase YrrM